MVENTVERKGETSCERRYYICSLALLVTLFAWIARSPYGRPLYSPTTLAAIPP